MERVAVDATASEIIEQIAVEKRLTAIGGKDSLTMMFEPGKPLESVPIGQFVDRCMSFLSDTKEARIIEAWRETNRAPLNEFWARSKSDALSLKKFTEQRLTEVSGV
jgi:hypothetical protein